MSYLFSEGSPEAEPTPSWYSVICGQGTYDIRAVSHADAGDRVQKYVKETNQSVGFPFTAEYPWRGVLSKEILWRLTGGDITKPDEVTPIMRHYAEPDPYVRKGMSEPAPAPTSEPQLFKFTQETNIVGHDIQGLIGREMLRHELIITQTWQDVI